MEYIKKFKEENGEKVFLYVVIAFLAGIIIGFIFSPIKKGIAVGSHNGSNNKFKNSNNVENMNDKKRKKLFRKCR